MRSAMLRTGGVSLLCALTLSACILATPSSIPQPTGRAKETGNSIIAPAPAAKRAKQLAFSPDTLVIAPNERKPLLDYLRDHEGLSPTQNVIWSSSNNTVASVNGRSGEILGLGEGTSVITATMENAPTIQAQLRLTVTTKPAVSLIRVTPEKPIVAIGENVRLIAEVHLPDGQIVSSVSWSSSDPEVATVGANGDVKGIREGRVTILASYTGDSRFKGVADVTVVTAMAPSPAATARPTAMPTPTPTSTPTPTPTPTPTATPTPSPTPSPSASPSASPSPSASASPAS